MWFKNNNVYSLPMPGTSSICIFSFFFARYDSNLKIEHLSGHGHTRIENRTTENLNLDDCRDLLISFIPSLLYDKLYIHLAFVSHFPSCMAHSPLLMDPHYSQNSLQGPP